MAEPTTARCLCGAVTLSIASPDKRIGACHCTNCRGWSGGPFLSVRCGSEVSIAGQEHVSVYEAAPWSERGFCSRCGTHLFYRVKQGQRYYVPAGLLDSCEGLVFETQVFVDSKPDYYDFANETKRLTGAELFAMFAPKK